MLPVPGVLMPTVPGLAFAAPARSASVLHGPVRLGASTIGAWLTSVTGRKSRSMFVRMSLANTAGFTTNSPSAPSAAWPSAGDLAAAVTAMKPLPPGRFSTMTCCFHFSQASGRRCAPQRRTKPPGATAPARGPASFGESDRVETGPGPAPWRRSKASASRARNNQSHSRNLPCSEWRGCGRAALRRTLYDAGSLQCGAVLTPLSARTAGC